MYRESPCRGLLDRKWEEVITDQTLAERLTECFKEEVFRLKPRYSFAVSFETSTISLLLNEHFFHNPQFYRSRAKLPPPHARRPSKGRIEKFYDKMLEIQRNFDNAFLITGNKPSLTYLKMHMKFRLERLETAGIEIAEASVRSVMEYLSHLFLDMLNEMTLLSEGYDFRPTL